MRKIKSFLFDMLQFIAISTVENTVCFYCNHIETSKVMWRIRVFYVTFEPWSSILLFLSILWSLM